MNKACFYGVGVGPGDPELITLKALRLIQEADVVSYLVNDKGHSYARNIVKEHLCTVSEKQLELPISVSTNINRIQANTAYDSACTVITQYLNKSKTVVFLCEGDPLFYASFAYLLERLNGYYPCIIVPGICSINAASAQLQTPLVLLSESLAVISSRHTDQKILDTLSQYDSIAIVKVGASRERIFNLIKQNGRLKDAVYLEHVTDSKQRIVRKISELDQQPGPYFSLIIITRTERSYR